MTDKMVEAYLKALENEERAAATIEKYRRALLSFAAFLSGAAVTREMIRLWKDDLRARNYGNVKKCAVGKHLKSEKLGGAGQAACCACAHSRYFTGGSPSGLRV